MPKKREIGGVWIVFSDVKSRFFMISDQISHIIYLFCIRWRRKPPLYPYSQKGMHLEAHYEKFIRLAAAVFSRWGTGLAGSATACIRIQCFLKVFEMKIVKARGRNLVFLRIKLASIKQLLE